MLKKQLISVYNKIVANRYYTSLFVILVIHIFSSPTYYAISEDFKTCSTCCNMQEKINRKNHLFESVSTKYDASTHMAKTEFRLTVPLLAKIFHINTKSEIYILQVLLGFLFFVLLYTVSYQIIPNKNIVFLFLMSFGFIYPGYSFVAEMEGFFDSFAFLFLLVAMLDINLIIIGIALLLAYFTDERSIFSSFLIIFYWQHKKYSTQQKSFYLPTKQTYAIVISIAFYIAARCALVNYFGFVNQFKGVGSSLLYTINYMGIAFWQAFEGFWLLIIIAVYLLFKQRKYAIAGIFITLNATIFFIGMNVMDITRSIAYIFPSIIIALYIISTQLDVSKIKRYLMICLLFSFMYPSYNFIVGKPPHSYNPIYMRVAKKLLHIP